MITNKHPRSDQYNSNDKEVYRSLVAQTRVKSFPNRTDGARPQATWKWKYMRKKIVIPGERIAEEEGSEDTDHTDTVSIGDVGESSDILSSDISPPGTSDISSPVHTRSYGKAKKTKDKRTHKEIFQFEVNIGWSNGGTCQLSWSSYVTSRFSELLINILQRMVSRYQH